MDAKTRLQTLDPIDWSKAIGAVFYVPSKSCGKDGARCAATPIKRSIGYTRREKKHIETAEEDFSRYIRAHTLILQEKRKIMFFNLGRSYFFEALLRYCPICSVSLAKVS